MLHFYHVIDVFILPSETECMPRVVLEAMSCGLPVVSTKVGNIPLLLTDNFLMPVQPDKLIIKKMNIILTKLKKNKNLRISTGERNRNFIEKNFSWEVIQPHWDKIFTSLYVRDFQKLIKINTSYFNKYPAFFKKHINSFN